MVDIEQYLVMFPFIGSVLTFLALLTPAAFYEYSIMGVTQVSRYVWMWGLEYIFYTGNNLIFFSAYSIILIPSIFCSIIIFIGDCLILNLVSKVWKGTRNIGDVEIYLLIIAAINIMTTIFWMIIMEILYFLVSLRTYSFWGSLHPGFGVIGIFIGAVLILIGIVIKRKILKYK